MTPADRDAREIRELAPGQTRLAHAAMRELRPDQHDADAFVAIVDETLRAGGYRLVGMFVPGERDAVAVAGFRVGHSLAWGRHLYVDDLSTAPHARRHGHAAELLAWLGAEARRLDCGQLHLDSGTGAQRFAAHRLYHRNGLAIHSHHFARAL
jgi:GNAT superfamily N-acetyltransferase